MKETREDIVQDVFFAIWENRSRISVKTSARSYLVTCARNHCLNYLQRNHERYYESLIQEQIPIYAESSEELYTWEELQTLLRQALDKLPENYRLAFEKNRFENKSYGEIAEEMQISIRTVERYKNKATELLKTELKDYLPLFIGWLFNRKGVPPSPFIVVYRWSNQIFTPQVKAGSHQTSGWRAVDKSHPSPLKLKRHGSRFRNYLKGIAFKSAAVPFFKRTRKKVVEVGITSKPSNLLNW